VWSRVKGPVAPKKAAAKIGEGGSVGGREKRRGDVFFAGRTCRSPDGGQQRGGRHDLEKRKGEKSSEEEKGTPCPNYSPGGRLPLRKKEKKAFLTRNWEKRGSGSSGGEGKGR